MSKVSSMYEAQVLLELIRTGNGERRLLDDDYLGKDQHYDEERYKIISFVEKPNENHADPPTREVIQLISEEDAKMLAGYLGLTLKSYDKGQDTVYVLEAPSGYQIEAGYVAKRWNSDCDVYRGYIGNDVHGWNAVGRGSRENITDPQTFLPEIMTTRWIADEQERAPVPYPVLA